MTTATTPERFLDAELCIVGAGYAALNGLNVAAKYLKKGARVVLIDKYDTWGGQWTHQYDYVRLHQPYRMFTAGDQPWKLARRPEYLATRQEILEHLASVPSVSAGHLDVQPLFGHEYRGHCIREGCAEIEAVSLSNRAPAQPVRIRARRLLKATGNDIQPIPPFRLASRRVRSVAVSDPVLMTPEFHDSTEPVYVVGSGKTAMDTVRHLLDGSGKRRRVHVITGSGMWFLVRDSLYARGLQRYTGGTLAGDCFIRVASLWDGDNNDEVMRTLERQGLVMDVFGEAGNFRLGLLSRAERAEIGTGVTDVHRGHLIDVDAGKMTIRCGQELSEVPVPDGAWFINCTTHFRNIPHEPMLQDGGITCVPQLALGFSGTSTYFITHLWFREELAAVASELFRFRFDVEPKLRFAPQFGLVILANMALVLPRLPYSVPARFRSDFNKWYPLVRQLPVLARLARSRGETIRKAERLVKMRYSDPADAA